MRLFLSVTLLYLSVLTCLAQGDSIQYQLILIGDAGSANTDALRDIVSRYATPSATPSAVIYLGDNLYPKGLPGVHHKDRKQAEQILLNELSIASGLGNIYFVPGNHDWKNGHHEGLTYRANQQQFLDSLKRPDVHLLPRDGCPGPEEIHLSKDLVLIIVDTQWFLHPWHKPEGENSHCDSKTPADVTIHLDDIMNRNRGKRVIVAGHHPVFTYGPHGGIFTFKDHLFPLTEIGKSLYLPLPIVGSLVPLYRMIFGDIQDTSHPSNKALRNGLREILQQYPGTTYVSGHEHTLQYIEYDSVQYIVSGAGSKSSPVKKKGYSQFASSDFGFAKLLVMRSGKARVEYYTTQGKVFSTRLADVLPVEAEKVVMEGNEAMSVTVNASYRYEAGNFRRGLLGDNYRDEWATKLHMPAFDIGREKGGLKIIQKGGGLETMALRLRDSSGHEYTLRTVEKYPSKALPATFRKTFVQAIKQDQVSAQHPYAALVIPPLAEAAKVFHANPKLVYAPNDLRWGIYRKDFAGQLMMFEERPDGSGAGMPFFGNAEKIISTRRLLEHMAHDNSYHIDQREVLRARLFDMWIGDWDRHDDQWRWGEHESKKVKTYFAIPRDRDHAFFVNEGLAPNRWRKRHIFPNLEGFDYDIRWAPGLMQVGRWFDRTFLNEMTETDFQKVARDMAGDLTDRVIDSSMRRWPSEIYELHGKQVRDKLKSRRSTLEQNALLYYHFLARQVDIAGSNKKEWFEATWLPGGNLNVQMFKRDKGGGRGKLLYEREFKLHQTKEICLYGLDGDDVFHFSGSGHRGIRIRVIGGEGKDEIKNESIDASKVYLYDTKDGITIEGKAIRNRTSNDPDVNEYDRKAFEYDKLAPRNTITYNIDDGVFIGTGFAATIHGFRKKPYKSHHFFQGLYAIKTQSFNIRYEGRFPHFVGKWDLELDADVKSPNYVNNFFGWGNESVFDQNINQRPDISVTNSIDYYRLRFREMKAEVKLRRKIGQWGYIKAGPVYQRGEIVNPTEDRYIKEYDATLAESVLGQPKNFAGITYTWGIDKRNNHTYTTRGIVFKQSSRWMDGFDAPGFSSHTANFTVYQSFRIPATVTYVFNAGAGHNTGTYQLYQAQALDGKTEIRGFHKTRFYGDTKLYFNNEVRIRLGSLRTYLFPASIGIHAFYDVGRVWYKDANGIDPSAPGGDSDTWHKGFGGGLWLTPFELTTIVTEVGTSKEGTLFYLRLGYLF
jgi:hypothetical protein